jgi:hypothetical protein
VTEDEIAALFQKVGESSLDDAANTVGSLSVSQVGNGQAPTVGPKETAEFLAKTETQLRGILTDSGVKLVR